MALDYAAEDEAPEAGAVAPLVAALDVGVSKTVCLAARRDPVLDMHPERPMRVLGLSVQSAPVSASGKAADFDACARAIGVAIDEASAMAGAPIARVVASYAGPGLGARVVRGAVRIRHKIVSGRDVDAALNAALHSAPSPQLTLLHMEPLRYCVDDGPALSDPTGVDGKMLQVEACVVTAPTDAVNALKACIRQAGAEVEDVVPAPQAAGIAALTPEERAGALVLDMGAGALGMAVFAKEGLVHAESVPMGGVRLTRDLAKKLETSFAAAERVKLAFGAVGATFDPKEAVSAPKIGPEGRLEAATTLRSVIAETLSPRLREMLIAARQRLVRAGFDGEHGPQRAVLVGGGASLPGLRELAADSLGMPVRIGRPAELCGFEHGEAGPAFACAAGLLRWRFDNPTLDDVDQDFQPTLAHAAQMMRNAAGNAWLWLRENF
ncbi:MAG TPA: cell division protein FtsA [Caulobacterales bacterium]|nr:cell division protein FtsA [Caulobacterales bacterium]